MAKSWRLCKYCSKEFLVENREINRGNGRIPLHEEFNSNPRYPSPDTYKVAFGSWDRAIEEAGFNPNDSSWGFVSLAKDGHRCYSLAEKIIDNWLAEHSISHEKEAFCPASLRRADWRVGDERDFCEGVKFLHMSIQFLRNKKAHTPARELDKNLAIHYISLSSLAYDLITRK